MANFRFVFQQAGDCLEFLDLVIRNLEGLGLNRNQLRGEVGRLDTDRPNCAITLHEALPGVGRTLLNMARCSDYQESAAIDRRGKPINEFLAGIPLIRPSRSPSDHPLAVLLFEAGKPEFRACYSSLLDLGCRGLRVGQMSAAENHGLSHLILIDSPPATFWPPAEWAWNDRGQRQAVACYRLRASEACQLYVEWNCEYPYRNIEQLYDFKDPRCHSVFALARNEDDPHAEAPWIRLLQQDYEPLFVLPEQRVTVGFDPSTVTIDLTPPDLDSREQIEFDFEVRSEARSVNASPEALEQKIAYHAQAIVDLRRDHHSATEIRRKPIYLAYLFNQVLGGSNEPPAPLSRPFARFLDQPFGQLEEMEYGFYETRAEDGTRQGVHVVFDNRPQSHVQLLTSLADEVYVQQAQWKDRDWDLPLYIRRGDDMRPRIDDPGIARVVRDLLWQGQPASDPILLRSRPSADGGEPWELLRVQERNKLTDSFAHLNDRFTRDVLKFQEELPDSLVERIGAVQQPLADHGTELVDQLVEAAESLIQTAAEEWNTLRERIKTVRDQCGEHADAVVAVQTAIDDFPGRWLDFVKNILDADRLLFAKKITAAGKYAKAKADLELSLKEREAALLNVRHQVQGDQENVEKRQDLFENAVHEVDQTIEDLNAALATFRQRQHVVQQELEDKREDAESRVTEVKTQLKEAKKEEDELVSELEKLKHQERNLRKTRESVDKLFPTAKREREKLEDENNKLLGEQTRLAELQKGNESLRSEVRDLESQNQAARTRLEEERSNLTARKAKSKEDLAERQRAVDDARKELAEVEEKTRELGESVARLKQEGQLAQKGRNSAEEQLREYEKEKQKRDRELEELQRKREKLQEDRKQLAEQRKQQEEEEKEIGDERKELDAAEEQQRNEHLKRLDELQSRLKLLHRRRAALQSLLNMAESLTGDLGGTPASEEEVSQPSELPICETTHAELLKQIRQHLLPPNHPLEAPLDQRGTNS